MHETDPHSAEDCGPLYSACTRISPFVEVNVRNAGAQRRLAEPKARHCRRMKYRDTERVLGSSHFLWPIEHAAAAPPNTVAFLWMRRRRAVEIVAILDDFSERGCVRSTSRSASRPPGFRFYSNPLCRSWVLRLVLRTQPRSGGG